MIFKLKVINSSMKKASKIVYKNLFFDQNIIKFNV